MTVAELIKCLQALPQNATVVVFDNEFDGLGSFESSGVQYCRGLVCIHDWRAPLTDPRLQPLHVDGCLWHNPHGLPDSLNRKRKTDDEN